MIPPPPNWLRIWSLKGAIFAALFYTIVNLYWDGAYFQAIVGVLIFWDAIWAKIEPHDLLPEEKE